MGDADKLFKALLDLTSNQGLYHNKWICDESWARILTMHYTNFKKMDKIRTKLVKKLNFEAGSFDDSNTHKIYKANSSKSFVPLKERGDQLTFSMSERGEYPSSQQHPLMCLVRRPNFSCLSVM